jgi:adenylate cyclase
MSREEKEMAVLFADIGSDAVQSGDPNEAITLDIEHEWIAQIRSLAPGYEGRLVKLIGNGVLCVFSSAEQGMMAASAAQSAIAARAPPGSGIGLQIGMHWGKVVFEGSDAFGESVNAAAYLATVATPGQIVTTETIYKMLPEFLRGLVRPIFRTVLKGETAEATVYEIMWKADKADLTDNLFADFKPQVVPADTGGLLLVYRDKTLRVDRQNRHAVLGRHSTSNLVIHDGAASRYHARIELRGVDFFLNDISINGTFVLSEGQSEVHAVRREVRLEGGGKISLGRSFKMNPGEIVEYSRDRRSLFRV